MYVCAHICMGVYKSEIDVGLPQLLSILFSEPGSLTVPGNLLIQEYPISALPAPG